MSKNILVDDKKKLRAEQIVELFNRDPKTEEEVNLKEKFSALVEQDEVKNVDLLEYVYTKLGGLVRTPTEEVEAKKKEKEIKERYEKRKKSNRAKDDEDDN